MTIMKLLSFGEVLWDIYPDKKHIGGAPFNVAAHFSKLGGNSYMLSAVGSDELGNETQKKLRELNINTEKFVTRNYDLEENLPWDNIIIEHPGKELLKKEFERLKKYQTEL